MRRKGRVIYSSFFVSLLLFNVILIRTMFKIIADIRSTMVSPACHCINTLPNAPNDAKLAIESFASIIFEVCS